MTALRRRLSKQPSIILFNQKSQKKAGDLSKAIKLKRNHFDLECFPDFGFEDPLTFELRGEDMRSKDQKQRVANAIPVQIHAHNSESPERPSIIDLINIDAIDQEIVNPP